MRWLRDLSGVLEEFCDAAAAPAVLVGLWEAVVPLALDMGGESTHHPTPCGGEFR
jgi:hypothetical protein